MNINLFMYYEMGTSNEQPVLNAIHQLGNVTRLGNGFWYINSSVDANEALKRVSSWMTDNDRLIVIDSQNDSVVWFNLDDQRAQRIRQNWTMPLGPKTELEADVEKESSTTH